MKAWRQGRSSTNTLILSSRPIFPSGDDIVTRGQHVHVNNRQLSPVSAAGEVHLLVKEQESAVKAVRLERLVGNIGHVRLPSIACLRHSF